MIRNVFLRLVHIIKKFIKLFYLIICSLFASRYYIKRLYMCNGGLKGKVMPYIDTVERASVY